MSKDLIISKDKDLEIPLQPEVLPVLIDPEKQIEFGRRAAQALTEVIKNKKKKVIIGGEQYLEFEDWQTIGRFYNLTVGAEWTKEINREGKLAGFESKANVFDGRGIIISNAEASCLRDEPNWTLKPEFQLKSMAQTRACAKALRNVLAWVVVLAGYKPTPAEEIDNLADKGGEPFENNAKVGNIPTTKTPPVADLKGYAVCSDCQVSISQAEVDYSQKNYKLVLCRKCQMKYKARK